MPDCENCAEQFYCAAVYRAEMEKRMALFHGNHIEVTIHCPREEHTEVSG